MTALRRWLATIAVAIVVASACVGAGLWQWHRHVDRAAAIDLVEQNYGAPPAALQTLVDGPGQPLRADAVWRQASARGRYLDAPVLLRNRPVDSRPGFHVLAPFLVEEGPLAGSVLVVDRGWVPTGEVGSADVEAPDAPAGGIDLLVRLRAAERPAVRNAPDGQVQAIAPDQVRTAADDPAWPAQATLGAYGVLVAEDGRVPADLGPLPAPSTDPGPHLSYAFQWWVFALGALVGCAVLIRRESGQDDAPDLSPADAPAAAGAPARARPQRSRRRGPTAEEEEDAILDAQQAR